MAAGKKVLVANGDTLVQLLAQDKSTAVSYQTDSATPANAVIVLEGILDPALGANNWFTLATIDPTSGAGALQTSITGATKAGVCPINAASLIAVRARRTDANGGNATVYLSVSTA